MNSKVLRRSACFTVAGTVLACVMFSAPPVSTPRRFALFSLSVLLAVFGRMVLLRRWWVRGVGLLGMFVLTDYVWRALRDANPSDWKWSGNLSWLAGVVMLGATFEFLPRFWAYYTRRRRLRSLTGILGDGPRDRRRVRIIAICLVAYWLALVYPPTCVTVRFWASASDFEKQAQSILAQNRSDPQAQWIGLFYVRRAVLQSRGTIEFRTSYYYDGDAGFVYVPDGQTLGYPMTAWRIPLTDHWWMFRR